MCGCRLLGACPDVQGRFCGLLGLLPPPFGSLGEPLTKYLVDWLWLVTKEQGPPGFRSLASRGCRVRGPSFFDVCLFCTSVHFFCDFKVHYFCSQGFEKALYRGALLGNLKTMMMEVRTEEVHVKLRPMNKIYILIILLYIFIQYILHALSKSKNRLC